MVFVVNFMRFTAVQYFWKSVKIWESYREFKDGNFLWDSAVSILLLLWLVVSTSGSGYPVMTHSSRVWLPSSTVLSSSGCTKRGLTGLRAPALTAAVSTAGASTNDRWHDVRASPPKFLAITVYVPQSSLNTSRMSRVVTPAFTVI